jgi:hypothetical protein
MGTLSPTVTINLTELLLRTQGMLRFLLLPIALIASMIDMLQ